MSSFTSRLLVSPFPDGRTWEVMREFCYDVGEEGSGDTITVPTGFRTDFASIPRPFWWILPRWGKYGNAAVVHDYMYWYGKRTRRIADDIFLEGMRVLKVNYVIRYAMYWAVRWFGSFSYKKNKCHNCSGCK